MVAPLLIALLPTDGWETMAGVLDKYTKHKSLTCHIIHADSSGLFPGTFEQSLAWKSGGRFELKVTKPPVATAGAESRGVPDYYCDGKRVLTVWPSGERSEDKIKEENSSPGWEVTTGLILMWLMDSPNKNLFTKPPTGIQFTFALGAEEDWDGSRALPLQVSVEQDGNPVPATASFFMSNDKALFLGYHWEQGGKKGTMTVRSTVFDKDLPDTLGDGPS